MTMGADRVVIKNPMDLQTIMKNIKAHKYRSKADFAADLELIWDNCAYYNTLEVRSNGPLGDGSSRLDPPNPSSSAIPQAESRPPPRIPRGPKRTVGLNAPRPCYPFRALSRRKCPDPTVTAPPVISATGR